MLRSSDKDQSTRGAREDKAPSTPAVTLDRSLSSQKAAEQQILRSISMALQRPIKPSREAGSA
jgi:hypothetical protein